MHPPSHDPFAGERPARRRLLRRALERLDERYRERGGLVAVGPMLYVGLARHAGPASVLEDGTRLDPGAWIGRLHFNNARAAEVQAERRSQAGIRFGRLLRDSFAELAERARNENRLREVGAFEGVTWLRAHGGAVGFEARVLPQGPRRWLLGLHFRLLIWAFAPVARGAALLDVTPHRFRISRRALIEAFDVQRAPAARGRAARQA